ncbi:MAG: phosphate propanoyltransferase [Firmicutes bacterium]|nr:phosphate propanoyltransferase [Bacillota bacterium]
MSLNTREIEQIVEKVLQQLSNRKEIPVGVSNRHVHLSRDHVEILFGKGYSLTKMKELQPGQFAARETVTLVGRKGVLEKVRVLGPSRNMTQVEISLTDGYKLGLKPPIRDSGDLKGSEGVTIVGPEGSIKLKEGVICAARHIHMTPQDAATWDVKDGDRVDVEIKGIRGLVFKNVLVRVSPKYRLEMHIDTDEANAAGLETGDTVEIKGWKYWRT